MNFYDLEYKTPAGKNIKLENFKGKVVLIVNTATQCRLTPQFDQLEALHQKYRDKGLVILGFPCNQFKEQEPETNDSIVEACRINYGVTFQLSEKINVNGRNTHPVFAFLKSKLRKWFWRDIKWNFTKFLIDAQGRPVKRYLPTTKPVKTEKDIISLLRSVNS